MPGEKYRSLITMKELVENFKIDSEKIKYGESRSSYLQYSSKSEIKSKINSILMHFNQSDNYPEIWNDVEKYIKTYSEAMANE